MEEPTECDVFVSLFPPFFLLLQSRVEYTLFQMIKDETDIVPETKEGWVRVGKQVGTVASGAEPDFYGAVLNVGDLNVRFYTSDVTPHTAEFEGAASVNLPGMELNVHGYDQATTSTYQDHALFISSRRLIKADTPSLYVGSGQIGALPTQTQLPATQQELYDGGWAGGAIQLNGTGMAQTALDFPLMLHTRQTALANGGTAGVKVMGTYKLEVGGITIRDTNDGRAPDATSNGRHTRRISSTGSLRLSMFDASTNFGVIPDFGAGTGVTEKAEVYVDGNERKGQARFRVGNAILHDAWTDPNGPAFLHTVQDGVHIQR